MALMKVAYIMSRFPKLTETFILNEILEQERQGIRVRLYPLLREYQAVCHPEVESLVKGACYQPFLSRAIVAANWRYFTRAPRRYCAALLETLCGTFGSPKFFVGAVGIWPKSALFAYDMERQGITHVHAHFATHPAVAALIVHRLTGIPFSFTAHGTDLHRDQRMLATKVAASAFTVTVSQYNKDFIAERCGESAREKVEVIRCGIDPEYFKPPPHPRRAGRARMVCVASFEEVKGHKFLIEACRLLNQRAIDFECHLVGAGPRRREVEQQIAVAELTDVVYVRGPQPRPVIREILADSDIAVLSSIRTRSGQREGIPVALMEAMACGLPVVSSRLSGIPELVQAGVSGLLVEPGDSRALADALERLIFDPPLRRKLGIAARQKILSEFTLTGNTEKLASLFRGSPSPNDEKSAEAKQHAALERKLALR